MKKINWYLINILTLGGFYFYSLSKAKKQALNVNTKLKQSEKIQFHINDLINFLGGKDNIINSSSTISSVKVKVNNTNVVNIENIKKLGCNGIMKAIDSYTLVFGDNSPTISKLINDHLTHH